MYSMVLMAALATSEQAPEFGLRRHMGGGGCHGCMGGCYGGGCHGCFGGCYGCYGGGCHGCYGCYGGGGCHGFAGYACHGGFACHGCHGGGLGWHAPYVPPGWSCYGGCGGYMSMAYAPVPTMVLPGTATTLPSRPMDKEKEREPDRAGGEGERGALVIAIPEGARVYVDDRPVTIEGTTRTFRTPMLSNGQRYFYEVRVEVMQQGEPKAETRKVYVRAGETSRADFRGMATVSAAGER